MGWGAQQLWDKDSVHGERERQQVLLLPKVKGGTLEGSLVKLGYLQEGRLVFYFPVRCLSHRTYCPTSVFLEQRRRELEKTQRYLL